MFSNEDPDHIIQKQERQIQELEIRLNTLQGLVDKLYDEIGVSPNELDAAFQKSDHFSPEEWKDVQAQKRALDKQFEISLTQNQSPQKTSQSRKELSELKRDWIFVR